LKKFLATFEQIPLEQYPTGL